MMSLLTEKLEVPLATLDLDQTIDNRGMMTETETEEGISLADEMTEIRDQDNRIEMEAPASSTQTYRTQMRSQLCDFVYL